MDMPLLIALIIIAVGFIGALLPVVPGVPLVFVGTLVYAVLTGFERIGPVLLGLFLVLTIVSMLFDWFAAALGARRFGASRWGIVGALIGFAIGLLVFPPFGALIGPVLGAIIAEMVRGRTSQEAVRSGIGALAGYLLSILVDLGMAALMTGIFLARVLTR
jgi:uncharacterized protein YqgC (DUF456 family)